MCFMVKEGTECLGSWLTLSCVDCDLRVDVNGNNNRATENKAPAMTQAATLGA